MNKYLKGILGTLIILIPVLITIGIFFANLTSKSFYETAGTRTIEGIKSPVKIYTSDYGVPHILGTSEEDVFFTMGYIHAKDRLWQMDLSRRVTEGRLSEVMGSATLRYDKLFRIIGINRASIQIYNNLSIHSKEILTAYSRGVNNFIAEHRNKLPIEFDALGYEPEQWKPEHSIMLGRLMGWGLNVSWITDYVLGEIIDKVGLEKTSEIFPDTTLKIYTKIEKPVEEDSIKKDSKEDIGAIKDYLNTEKVFAETFQDYRKFFGIDCSHIGSNAFVIGADKSETGKSILANDPHLALQTPSHWYEIYLKSSNFEVRGMSMPGVPCVLIGNNRFISWGVTSLMSDDVDFVLLSRDSANYNKYIYKKQSYNLDSLIETIKVKDEDDVIIKVELTKEGPVLNGIDIPRFDTGRIDDKISKNKLLTMKWIGYEPTDEINTFFNLSVAKSWDDFKSALKTYGIPTMNFMYADIEGNIGYHAGGKIPVRNVQNIEHLSPNDIETTDWTGFVDFDKLPNQYNPKEGFIVTANTNPFDWIGIEAKSRFYIGYGWESSSRYDKIKEMIQKRTKLGADDIKLIQMNYESNYAKDISKYITEAFNNHKTDDPNLIIVVERFKNWNGDLNPKDYMGTIYSRFFVKLLKNIFKDELGDKIFEDMLGVSNFPIRSVLKLLKDYKPENKNWFDNTETASIETRDDIIVKSLTEAMTELTSEYGNNDINSWEWGKQHKITFKHPMGIVPALSITFNIGPYEVGGDNTTINNGEYNLLQAYKSNKYANTLGPSMRIIIDMTNVSNSYSVNSTGQSGQPMHSNYSDQSRLWYFGEYKINTMNESEMIRHNYNLLTLTPR